MNSDSRDTSNPGNRIPSDASGAISSFSVTRSRFENAVYRLSMYLLHDVGADCCDANFMKISTVYVDLSQVICLQGQ